MTELDHYLDIFEREALPIIQETGKYIFRELQGFDHSKVETKEKNSLVSYVDKMAEKRLVAGLDNLYPDAGYITEEEVTETKLRELTWIIDPLDGTTNFLQGIPIFCVSVALRHHDEIIAGAVYDPARDEMFWALSGHGAYVNESRIEASAKKILSEAIIGTGFPYHDMSQLEGHLDMLADMLRRGRGMRRLGSAALDMAYVAAGRLDVFYEHTLNIWDIAAGIVLVQEAGGVVTDYEGGQQAGTTGMVVASNKALHPVILDAIRTHIL